MVAKSERLGETIQALGRRRSGAGGDAIKGLGTTGIRELDFRLGGGVPFGSSLLLVGTPSNAPYLFCEQFVAGSLRAGATVHHVNLERPEWEVQQRLDTLGVARDNPRLHYYDYYSLKLRGLGEAALAKLHLKNHVPDVTATLVPMLLEQDLQPGDCVAIESLTELIPQYGLAQTTQMVHALTGLLKVTRAIGFFMLERGMFPPEVEVSFRHAMDGVFELGTQQDNFDLHPYLAVTKMRGLPGTAHVHWYQETEQGLVFENIRRVY